MDKDDLQVGKRNLEMQKHNFGASWFLCTKLGAQAYKHCAALFAASLASFDPTVVENNLCAAYARHGRQA